MRQVTVCVLAVCNPANHSCMFPETPHLPDLTTQAGLLDVLALGHVLLFSDLLRPNALFDQDQHAATLPADPESNPASERCHQFRQFFLSRYTVQIEGIIVDAEQVVFDVCPSILFSLLYAHIR